MEDLTQALKRNEISYVLEQLATASNIDISEYKAYYETHNRLNAPLKKKLRQLIQAQRANSSSTTIINNGNNNTIFSGVSGSTINMGGGRAPIAPAVRHRILFVGANPQDAAQLNQLKEYNDIKEAIAKGKDCTMLDFMQPVLATIRMRFADAVAQKPSIFHFSGHGEPDGLILEDDEGYSSLLDKESMQFYFSVLKGSVEVIVLNSCYSAEQGAWLSELTDAIVVGYQVAVGDPHATAFAQGFYMGLAAGNSIAESLQLALGQMRGQEAGSEAIVELWNKGEKMPF
jgi:hypothetical protein